MNQAAALGWLVHLCACATSPAVEMPDGGGGRVDAATATPDAFAGDPDSRGDAGPCVSTDVAAHEAVLPIDIIWVIDNSGSMLAEEARVQNNMNAFAESIAASGIDYRVVVVSATTHVNVPPPLGGSDRFLAVDQEIGSSNALEAIVLTYPLWQGFLRADSVKHFVVVTDDESGWPQAQFEEAMAGLSDPGFPDGFTFHAVVADFYGFDPYHDCYGIAEHIGQIYMDLQRAHGGLFFSLCSPDWSALFPALSTAVKHHVALPCTYEIPPPPNVSQDIDIGAVNFVFTPTGGAAKTIPYVGSEISCAGAGWYYDNLEMPTQVKLCPETCSAVSADATGQVAVAFGCATLIP